MIRDAQGYSPNMTRDNVIAVSFFTSCGIEMPHTDMDAGAIGSPYASASQMDRFGPVPKFSNYRTPI